MIFELMKRHFEELFAETIFLKESVFENENVANVKMNFFFVKEKKVHNKKQKVK